MSQNKDTLEAGQVVLGDQDDGNRCFTQSDYLKFIIPSLIGALFFLVPIFIDGKVTIGMGVISDYFKLVLKDYLPGITVFLLSFSAVLSVVFSLFISPKKKALQSIFKVSLPWLLLRVLGAVFVICTWQEVGPEWIWDRNTGGVVLYDLAPALITFFFFASLLLPLLVDFGLMEFVGTLVRNVFRTIFRLPGRSSIDAVASWIGSGTVGVLITTQQYEGGFYSKRESAVIATNFSIASIAFSLVVASFIGIDHLFIEFYASVLIAGLIAAIITPRLPPLCWKKDEYVEGVGKQLTEDNHGDISLFRWGLHQAVARASKAPKAGQVVKMGLHNVADIWFGLLPLVMAIGTIAMALTEYTQIFVWLSKPIIPLLDLLQIPEAAKAAPAFLVGFADMFLPAIVGKGIESELTRFVIAGVSMTQLIYMSEVGLLLMKSKIPLNFVELAVIFILRTLITLPIIALLGHWWV
ncbi:YjiH family protein [Rhodanobacter aciditrophus]|uniref:YjiH family protein n=1 Tax=Rhodanobacter aciditrophus TaxID=1623218 RepID=A0ABW4AZT3_9GAMM